MLARGVASYLHLDHLGSVRAITDTTGARIESAVYKPFGEQTETLSPANLTPESKGWIGERYDADAGLQYLNARYYDPVLGMFLQPDWFEVLRPGVGTNRFSYSFNDPVNMSDPMGNCAWDLCIGESWATYALGAAVVAYVVTDTIDNGTPDGSILSTPLENFDFGDEGFTSDPGASNPSILSTPIDGGPDLSIEGMTPHITSGPSILSTPINDVQLGANIMEASRLRGALGLATGQRELAHHNIPQQHKGLPAVQAGIRAGYEFDGAMNGTRVLGQAGGHPAYNRRIGRELEDLWTLGQAEGWTDAQYRDKLSEISDRERDRIENDNRHVRNE